MCSDREVAIRRKKFLLTLAHVGVAILLAALTFSVSKVVVEDFFQLNPNRSLWIGLPEWFGSPRRLLFIISSLVGSIPLISLYRYFKAGGLEDEMRPLWERDTRWRNREVVFSPLNDAKGKLAGAVAGAFILIWAISAVYQSLIRDFQPVVLILGVFGVCLLWLVISTLNDLRRFQAYGVSRLRCISYPFFVGQSSELEFGLSPTFALKQIDKATAAIKCTRVYSVPDSSASASIMRTVREEIFNLDLSDQFSSGLVSPESLRIQFIIPAGLPQVTPELPGGSFYVGDRFEWEVLIYIEVSGQLSYSARFPIPVFQE